MHGTLTRGTALRGAEYTAIALTFFAMCFGLYLARVYDDSKAYVHFYPWWHEWCALPLRPLAATISTFHLPRLVSDRFGRRA